MTTPNAWLYRPREFAILRKMGLLLALIALTTLAPQDGRAPAPSAQSAPPAKQLPSCVFEGGAALIERKADLPAEASSELDRLFAQIGGIAEAGQFYESSDVQMTKGPKARFIRAYHVGDLWFVWFERGGIGVSSYTLALAPSLEDASGRKVLKMAPGSSFQGDLCAGSKAFIAGARSGG